MLTRPVTPLSERLALAQLAVARASLLDTREALLQLVRPDGCPEPNPLNKDQA